MGKTPGKPRGKMSAYAFFVQSCREEFRKQQPEERVVFAEFSKMCAQRWKSMEPGDRKRFDDMAERDKVRFENDMRAFLAMPPMSVTKRRKKMTKDPNAPKRALSAFFVFCNEVRPVVRQLHPTYSVSDVAKELGRRWETCTDRDKYDALAAQDKLRYRQEMSIYRRQSCDNLPETDTGTGTSRSVSVSRASLPALQSSAASPDEDEHAGAAAVTDQPAAAAAGGGGGHEYEDDDVDAE